MPRPDLTINLAPAPLTLTVVAEKLGISASTLRTWERRYGLGPQRQTGTHRRYTVAEFELIQAVVELVRSGVSPSDACQSIQDANAVYHANQKTVCVNSIIEHAKASNATALHADLDILITRDGLLKTWSEYIQPALVALQTDPEGELPGTAPRALLSQMTLQVVREVANCKECQPKETNDAVVVVSDEPRSLLAHVIGVSLHWEGIPTRLMPALLPVTALHADVPSMLEKTRHLVTKLNAKILVICGSIIHNEAYLRELENTDLQLVLVGPARPNYLPANAIQMRTASGCVEEVVATLRGY
ncbi:MerR family transcriptional regulator [Gleimia coleocanis]|nr:MerR family transcriptional regulator [Gleimia coleocanis]